MKKLLTLALTLLLLLSSVSAFAEYWIGSYECTYGGVVGFDPMGTLEIEYDEFGDCYRFEGDVSLVTNFTLLSGGDEYNDTLYVTGYMSELNDDYSNTDGIYLEGTMFKSGAYIYFNVIYSDGTEVQPEDLFIFKEV